MIAKNKKLVVTFFVCFVVGIFFACTQKVVVKPSTAKAKEKVSEKKTKVSQKKKKEKPPLYSQPVTPLNTEECGRCHITVYETIRTQGTKHKLECSYCHKQYHVYNPKKQNYDEIIPHCESCHGTPHGKVLVKCLECHVKAHAPKQIPMSVVLEKECGNCHKKEAVELKKYPSKHTKVACAKCHTSHGSIPECAKCHKSHSPGLANKDCLSCHPVHSPLQIVYSVDTPQETCGGCHKKAYGLLKQSNTKHTALTCAKCHPKHKQIMACSQCHKTPHSAAMLKKFKACGDCHGIAHSLQ